MIALSIIEKLAEYQKEFRGNPPFPYIVLDDFLEKDYAEQLLIDFPEIISHRSVNQTDDFEEKSIVEEIDHISPFFSGFYDYINSNKFLAIISALTGINDLLPDTKMLGGGAHEYFDGQGLDPHIDANYLDSKRLYRRLNMQLFLNKDWDDSWGAVAELHSDPRNPSKDKISTISPVFNKCVIFEISEHSWHGISKVCLPKNQKSLSRKSLNLYIYTRNRPTDETVPSHSAIYAHPPIPEWFKSGYALKDEDIIEVRDLLKKRDRNIERLLEKEMSVSEKMHQITSQTEQMIAQKTPAVVGCVDLIKMPENYWAHDDWVAPNFEAEFLPYEKISGVIIRGRIVEDSPKDITLQASLDGKTLGEFQITGDSFEWLLKLSWDASKSFKLGITGDKWLNCKRDEISEDKRDLLFLLTEIRFFGLFPIGI